MKTVTPQSDPHQSQGLPFLDLVLVALVALFSCVIGYFVGSGGLNIKSRLEALVNPTTVSQVLPVASGGDLVPPQDGVYLVGPNSALTQIPVVTDDTHMDLAALPVTTAKQPTLAVRGDNLTLGDLKAWGYLAGIGVDAQFNQTGATIDAVFADSPAQAAGLQAGDLILSVDGTPVKQPMFFTPGQNDLIGPMQIAVQLEVVSGTTSRLVSLPRTYRGSVNSLLATQSGVVPFAVQPHSNYVVLQMTRDLPPGIYGLQLQHTEPAVAGDPFFVGSTRTPTPTPVPVTPQIWVFVVR